MFFFHWAKELIKNGNEVYVITQRFKNTKKIEIIQGINVFRVGSSPQLAGVLPVGIISNLSYFLGSFWLGLRLSKSKKIDLIHSNTYIPAISAQWCSKISHVPHIITIHDVYFGSRKDFWKNWSSQPGISQVTRIIGPLMEKIVSKLHVTIVHTVSDMSKKDLEKLGVKNQIRVIPNGIDLKIYEKHKVEEENQAIYVGRLVFFKNIETIIEAFRLVVDKIPKSTLIIIGEGPHKNYLMRLTESLGLKNSVLFLGNVSDEEKINLIHKSKLLLNPSLVEGFGMVVLEGFACKKPVLVSDTKPLSDLIKDGQDGYIIESKNSKQWASKIIEMLTDEKIAREFGNNGYQKVLNSYSLPNIVSKLFDLYEFAIKRSKKN